MDLRVSDFMLRSHGLGLRVLSLRLEGLSFNTQDL